MDQAQYSILLAIITVDFKKNELTLQLSTQQAQEALISNKQANGRNQDSPLVTLNLPQRFLNFYFHLGFEILVILICFLQRYQRPLELVLCWVSVTFTLGLSLIWVYCCLPESPQLRSPRGGRLQAKHPALLRETELTQKRRYWNPCLVASAEMAT